MTRRQRGFLVPTLYIALAAGLGGAMAATAVTRLYYLHEIEQTAQDAREAQDVAAESQRLAARAYEANKAERAVRQAITTRKVDHELEVHRDWSAEPVPDSVRSLLDAAGADGGAAEPGRAVPGIRGLADPAKR